MTEICTSEADGEDGIESPSRLVIDNITHGCCYVRASAKNLRLFILQNELTSCGHVSSTKGDWVIALDSLKCSPLPTNITSTLLSFSLSHLFFILNLILSEHCALWGVVVVAEVCCEE